MALFQLLYPLLSAGVCSTQFVDWHRESVIVTHAEAKPSFLFVHELASIHESEKEEKTSRGDVYVARLIYRGTLGLKVRLSSSDCKRLVQTVPSL